MSILIHSKATSIDRSRKLLLNYSSDAIASDQIFENSNYFNNLSSSGAYNNNKFLKWLKYNTWKLIISPFFLLGSILIYILIPSKVFDEKYQRKLLKTLTVYAKRLLDVIGAVIGLILGSVIFLLLPILIKLDSKGPVFYSQTRVGLNRRRKNRRIISASISANRRNGDRRAMVNHGKPFVIYKFRTMREDAEKKCGPVWASDNDPRITPLGRILRATHLDELPQLINILKGDMSFVGPRPERPHFVNKLASEIPMYVDRLKVKPGLTGLAQVKTGYDYSIESVKKKLNYDLEYCKNGNLVSYIKIMFVTFFKSFAGKIKI